MRNCYCDGRRVTTKSTARIVGIEPRIYTIARCHNHYSRRITSCCLHPNRIHVNTTTHGTWLTLNFTFHDKTLRMPSRFVWTIIIDDTAACVGKLGWRMTQFFRDGSQFCLTTGRIKPKHVGADRLTLISFVRSRFKRVCRVRMNGWVVATCIENRTDSIRSKVEKY